MAEAWEKNYVSLKNLFVRLGKNCPNDLTGDWAKIRKGFSSKPIASNARDSYAHYLHSVVVQRALVTCTKIFVCQNYALHTYM